MNHRTIQPNPVRRVRLAMLSLAGCAGLIVTLFLGAAASDPPASAPPKTEPAPGATVDVTVGTTRSAGAQVDRSDKEGETSTNVVRYVVELKGDNFELNIQDGEVVGATVNGDPLPANRIRKDDAHVILLDENGEPAQRLQVLMRGLDSDFMYRVMGDRRHNRPHALRFESTGGIWDMPRMQSISASFSRTMPEPSVMIGMYVQRTDPALAYHLDLAPDQTVTVTGVREDLPAYRAGIREYDVIVAIGEEGEPPVSRRNLYTRLQQVAPGEVIPLTIIQKGNLQQVSVTLEAFDRERLEQATLLGSESRRRGRFGSSPTPHPGFDAGYEGIMISPDRNLFLDGTLTNIDDVLGAELQLLFKETGANFGVMELGEWRDEEIVLESLGDKPPPSPSAPDREDDHKE